MATKDGRDGKRPAGAGKRKVGAVVMQRRGAQARLKKALTPEVQGGGDPPDERAPAPLKKRISRLKSKTKALAGKLSPGTSPRPPRRPKGG